MHSSNIRTIFNINKTVVFNYLLHDCRLLKGNFTFSLIEVASSWCNSA